MKDTKGSDQDQDQNNKSVLKEPVKEMARKIGNSINPPAKPPSPVTPKPPPPKHQESSINRPFEGLKNIIGRKEEIGQSQTSYGVGKPAFDNRKKS